MVDGEVVLSKTVWQIVLSIHPMNIKLYLSDSVSNPVKAHVYGSWTPLEDVTTAKSVSYGDVRHFWGGWLGVAHIYERHACRCTSMAVY